MSRRSIGVAPDEDWSDCEARVRSSWNSSSEVLNLKHLAFAKSDFFQFLWSMIICYLSGSRSGQLRERKSTDIKRQRRTPPLSLVWNNKKFNKEILMFLKPLSYPKNTLNTKWISDGRLNIWSARQVRKTTQRFKVKVALTYADSSSLPLVLQIFKGHPLFTKISVQIIGKGLEVVASPADPRLQRYVSFNNVLETITYHEQEKKCNACFHT